VVGLSHNFSKPEKLLSEMIKKERDVEGHREKVLPIQRSAKQPRGKKDKRHIKYDDPTPITDRRPLVSSREEHITVIEKQGH